MKNWIRRWLSTDDDDEVAPRRRARRSLPEELTHDRKILTNFSIVKADNGGMVLTSNWTSQNGSGYESRIHLIPEGTDLLESIAVLLVEARLK
jgi:hypothetical protein